MNYIAPKSQRENQGADPTTPETFCYIALRNIKARKLAKIMCHCIYQSIYLCKMKFSERCKHSKLSYCCLHYS